MSQSSSVRPPGYPAVCPYLTCRNAPGLLDFITTVFDAELLERHDEEGVVAHAAVRLGDSVVEVSEAREEWPATPAALHVYVEDTDVVHGKAVAAGAETLFEPADMPYGERSGGVRDPWGNNWYIATFTGR